MNFKKLNIFIVSYISIELYLTYVINITLPNYIYITLYLIYLLIMYNYFKYSVFLEMVQIVLI